MVDITPPAKPAPLLSVLFSQFRQQALKSVLSLCQRGALDTLPLPAWTTTLKPVIRLANASAPQFALSQGAVRVLHLAFWLT
jgi:hypothetical protein